MHHGTSIAVLQIDDDAEAVDFYVDKLGFEIDFEHRHEPGFQVFMGIAKGDPYLHLSEHGRGHPGTEVDVFVDDVGEWYERCRRGGIETDGPPTPMPWVNTEMPVSDPSRNLLRFTQRGTHAVADTPNG